MGNLDAQPVNSGTSAGASFACNVLVADPFTASNVTWTEIENSTAEDWGGFWVYQGTNGIKGILLVATGAASSETIIASMPISIGGREGFSMYVPIPITAGTRISLAASAAALTTILAQVVGVKSSAFDSTPTFTVLECGPFDLENNALTYGLGVSIDPGATLNTKGSYTEVSVSGINAGNNLIQGDSLAQTYDWFGFVTHDNFNTAQRNMNRLFDVATGAASSEVIFAPDIYERRSSSEMSSGSVIWDPGGQTSTTRISARMQAASDDVDDRLGSIFLFGLR